MAVPRFATRRLSRRQIRLGRENSEVAACNLRHWQEGGFDFGNKKSGQ